MKNTIDERYIDELLSRSVVEILPSREVLKETLLSGKRLRMYIGTDATGTSLHLGHATNYLILEKFRSLGHEVIFLIGDFTSRIGDPTGLDTARVPLSREQVVANTQTWLNQIRPIIDIDNAENPVKVLYNHEWLSQMTFEDVIDMSSNFTVQQMLERDMFQKRIADNKPIHVHEFFYPLMQGWDSVVMDVDMEICGNDQKFNALVGRTLQKRYHDKEKFVFITTLLENPITKEKMMSKSRGTGVYLDFTPENMYGAIMAQPDENIRQLFVDTTLLSLQEIDEIMSGDDKKEQKMRLAREIVTMYHTSDIATAAEQSWITTFSERGIPDEVATIPHTNEQLVDVLLAHGYIESRTEFRRLVDEGAIKVITDTEETKITDYKAVVASHTVYKIGKRRFLKVS